MIKHMRKLVGYGALALAAFSMIGGSQTVHAETGTLQKVPTGEEIYFEFRHPNATRNTFYNGTYLLRINGEDVVCLDPTTYAHETGYSGTAFPEYLKLQTSSGREYQLDRALQRKVALVWYYGYQSQPTYRNYHKTTAIVYNLLNYETKVARGVTMAEQEAFKATVLAKVNAHSINPSWNNTTHTVKVGETVTLTDANNVVQNLDIPSEINGFKTTITGNKLVLTATTNATSGSTSFRQKPDSRIHGTSIVYKANGSQTVAKMRLGDPQFGEVTINVTKNAKVKVVKTDLSNGQALEGVTFGLYDKTTNQLVKSAKTNAKGIVEFDITEPTRCSISKKPKRNKAIS